MGLYRAETYRVEDSVGFQITRLRAAVFAAVDSEVTPWGISSAQGAILIYIAHGRGNRAADIARDYSYDTGSMTRMIDRLVKKGLVRRVRDETDRRSVRLELTPKGTKLTDELPAVAARALNKLLRGFSRPELDQLKGYLDRMLANAE